MLITGLAFTSSLMHTLTRLSQFLLLLVCFFGTNTSVAKDTLLIGTIIPGLHQSDFLGKYDKIISLILNEQRGIVRANFPPARADSVFATCNSCCISPSNKNPDFHDYAAHVVTTNAFNVAKAYIFTAPGKEPLSDLSELHGKVVGVRFGMPYGKAFDATVKTKLAVSQMQEHIRLMELGHLDAFVAYAPDVYQMFELERIEPFPHDPEKPFAIHPDALSCKGVSEQFIDYFNQRLSELVENGTLSALLDVRYTPD